MQVLSIWHGCTSKKPTYKQSARIVLNTEQSTVPAWEASLARTEKEINVSKDKQATRRWWNDFWKRSFIEGEGEAGDAIRNYTLFRYMLGCNAYSQWPTKFNGGLFTFDPMYVDQKMEFTPDFRKWGGGTMTAQNQRLVYWPMLKSGDFDLMKSQFDFYLRLLPTAEARTRTYWGHAGACSPNKWRTSVCPILPSMALNVLKAMTGGWNIMHGWNTNGIRFLNFVR